MAVYRGRHVGYLEGLRYKGKGSMLAWALHRICGLGILLFVVTNQHAGQTLSLFSLTTLAGRIWDVTAVTYTRRLILTG